MCGLCGGVTDVKCINGGHKVAYRNWILPFHLLDPGVELRSLC